MPKGWKVVCRLSPGDARARWGSRPRPAAGGPNGAGGAVQQAPGGATAFEADLVLPELCGKPLRLPLQLLPQWMDPKVGSTDFLGRYVVKQALSVVPPRATAAFLLRDNSDKEECCLQVIDVRKEEDMRIFVDRLQLESLDTENRSFVRLRDVAVALPGPSQTARLAVIEDTPRRSLWQEFENGGSDGGGVVAKIAAIASAVLCGLSRLHAHGWAHCAVSPHTVCLARDGRWKLSNLESARRVRDLSVRGSMSTGTAVPPEALLSLPLTEKVDVWQLAATLCEAISRKRIIEGGDDDNLCAKLIRTMDFLGAPLPGGLVARVDPCREDLFTPEGQVLRPTTPDAAGAILFEAIEPAAGSRATSVNGGDSIPRPAVVVEALGQAEGAADLMEFLGRLLSPDPEQRPSAREASANHFLRHVDTRNGCDSEGGESPPKHKAGVNFQEENGGTAAGGGAKTQSTPTRKGTGFVRGSDLELEDDEEDEDERSKGHAQIQDAHGDNENKLQRKGTGFVHVGELPPSDDEDEEESPKSGHAKIQDVHGDNENKLQRKGTGFVHMGELPPSDSEEEEEVAKTAEKGHVSVQDSHGDNESKLQRKGTGFVHVGELPPTDDEDEEEDAKATHAKIEDSHGDNENKLQRKGTGFVHMGELPPSDEEDDEEEAKPACPHAMIKDIHGDNENKLQRKGTGFVHVGELPPSDDEDEDEAGKTGHAQIQDTHGDNENKLQRKGTGFVHVGELPPSDDEEEEEDDKKPKHAGIQDAHGDNESKLQRKGTGFVHVGELPPSDDEADEEDEASKSHAHFSAEDANKAAKEDLSSKIARKGTGFVNMSDMPLDDDDDDVEAGHVKFEEKAALAGKRCEGETASKPMRKGTGFVNPSELPDTDDEDNGED